MQAAKLLLANHHPKSFLRQNAVEQLPKNICMRKIMTDD